MSKKRFKQLMKEKQVVATPSKTRKGDDVQLYNITPVSYLKEQTRRLGRTGE